MSGPDCKCLTCAVKETILAWRRDDGTPSDIAHSIACLGWAAGMFLSYARRQGASDEDCREMLTSLLSEATTAAQANGYASADGLLKPVDAKARGLH